MKMFAKILAALDAPTLLNGAIKRGDMLSAHVYAKAADRKRLAITFTPANPDDQPGIFDMLLPHVYAKAADGKRLAITFTPANPDDQPDIDVFKIILLKPREDDAGGYQRGGRWYVDINRGHDHAENGKVAAVYDGSVRDGADNLVLADADAGSCRELVEALHGAVRVKMLAAMRQAREDREAA